MPRPMLPATLRKYLTSLLLALAVAFAWPSMSAPHGQDLQFGQHHVVAADAHAAGPQQASHEPAPACAPDLGCCVMAHCHPGVAEPLQDVPGAELYPQHEPSAPTREAGVDPALLVPPPRLLLG